MSDAIVYHRHMRALGYCNKGLRKWLAGRGIEWMDFLEHGAPAEFFRATGDAQAIKAAELAENEERA